MAKTSSKQRLKPRDTRLSSASKAMFSAFRRAKKGDPEDHLFSRYEAANTPLERRAIRATLLQVIAEKGQTKKPKTFRKVDPTPPPEPDPIVEEAPPPPKKPAREARTRMLDLSDAAMMLQFASSDPDETPEEETTAAEDSSAALTNAFAELESLPDAEPEETAPSEISPTDKPEDDALSTAFAASDADDDTATEGAEAENTAVEEALSDAFATLDTLPEPEGKNAANALDDAFAELTALNADAGAGAGAGAGEPSTSADTPQGENENALTDAYAALDTLDNSSEENPTVAEPSEPDASLESAFAALGELGTPQPAEEDDDNQS